jgi:hypothetical protein
LDLPLPKSNEDGKAIKLEASKHTDEANQEQRKKKKGCCRRFWSSKK